MLRNRKTMALATAALLLWGFSMTTARVEETGVPKRSAYPSLQDNPLTGIKPGLTATEQERLENLKKELNNARDHQSSARSKESGAGAKAKKP